jgi:hypothetical protein
MKPRTSLYRRSFRHPFALAAGTLATLTLISAGVPAQHSTQERKQEAKVVRRTTERTIADALDAIMQPRFQKDAGVFGISRLVPLIQGHNALGGSDIIAPAIDRGSQFRIRRNADDEREQTLITDAKQPGNLFIVGFLHIAHPQGQMQRPQNPPPRTPQRERLVILAVREEGQQAFFTRLTESEPVLRGNPSSPYEERVKAAYSNKSLVLEWERAAKKALPELRRGVPVETIVGDYTIFLRPVQAKQQVCLDCHPGATKDETLGVMLYAIAKKAPTVTMR